MMFWTLAGAIFVVLMGVVWWTSRRSNRAFDGMGEEYQRIQGQAGIQAQNTSHNIGDPWHG